jgi:hypothetical protein
VSVIHSDNDATELRAMGGLLRGAALDPEVRRALEGRDFEDAATRLIAIAGRIETARSHLRRALGALRDVERAGVSAALAEIDDDA